MLGAMRDHFNATRQRARRKDVTGNIGGHPLGAPPAIGDAPHIVQPTRWAGGDGFYNGIGVTPYIDAPDAAVSHILPAHRPPAFILPDVFRGTFNPVLAQALWWDNPRPAQDIAGQRHTRTAIDSYASLKARGSSDVASGPEGTLVLMPPRIPRQLATRRSVAGARAANVLLNYANNHVQTPSVTVVGSP